MAFSGADIIELVRERYAAYESRFEDRDLQWANDEIARHLRVTPEEDVDVTLTADETYHPYDADIAKVWAATYWPAAGSSYPLMETSVDDLDATFYGWRTQDASSNPYNYFDVGGNLGLYPKPDTTTTAGYPKVTLHCTKRAALTTSDSLPAHIADPSAWVALVCYRYALRSVKEDAAALSQEAGAALLSLSSLLNSTTARRHPGVRRTFPSIRNQ